MFASLFELVDMHLSSLLLVGTAAESDTSSLFCSSPLNRYKSGFLSWNSLLLTRLAMAFLIPLIIEFLFRSCILLYSILLSINSITYLIPIVITHFSFLLSFFLLYACIHLFSSDFVSYYSIESSLLVLPGDDCILLSNGEFFRDSGTDSFGDCWYWLYNGVGFGDLKLSWRYDWSF